LGEWEQITGKLKEQLCKMTRNGVVSEEEIENILIKDGDGDENKAEKELTDDSDIQRFLAESGCKICEDEEGKLSLSDCKTSEVGAGLNIDNGSCARDGGKPVGSFHTHPMGGTSPSVQDMEASLRDKERFFCIGGAVGKKTQITCYWPTIHAQENGLVYNMSNGYYPKTGEQPKGKIKFWRENPPPTPTELLAALGDKEIKDIMERRWGVTQKDDRTQAQIDEDIRAFKAKLEKGVIPDEYWEGYESDGTWDELKVYASEQLKQVDAAKKRHLFRDFFHQEFDCS
jgi:proteasome lid subunit RPN8/RPN11